MNPTNPPQPSAIALAAAKDTYYPATPINNEETIRRHALIIDRHYAKLTADLAAMTAIRDGEWKDKPDQYTKSIAASHPHETGDFKTYETAMAMVGNRHGKYELVDLVNWLLSKRFKLTAPTTVDAGPSDGERLDWLEARGWGVSRSAGWGTPFSFQVKHNQDGLATPCESTIRAAIDAAMKRTP